MAINAKKRNEYALVTGGTSGIGYELAKLLAKDGYNLVLVARSSERLLEASDEFQELGVDVLLIDKDLSDPRAAKEIYRELRSKNIIVEILINDAGQDQKGTFQDVDLERHLEIMQLNIVSLVTATKLFLTDMLYRKKGKILNLVSVVSKTPAPEFSVYAASKAFVMSFSEGLAKELKGTNITITALIPGKTDHDFFNKAVMPETADTREYQDQRLADPPDVAKDGYDAMMSGESRVVSGKQNKLTFGMIDAMPDSPNASMVQKNIQPSENDDDERKQRPAHPASDKEREARDKEEV